jgi:1-acyl-sn-glycerol-3-phosphate acyltransferase
VAEARARVRGRMGKRSLSFAFAAGIIKPVMLAVTKRDWRGVEHFPAVGGCIVVPNHVSELDPLVIAHYIFDHARRRPRFLGKAEVFKVPVLGRILKAAGQIPVYRRSADASHAFQAAVDAARGGEAIIVYAEGTISRDPDLWPMVGKTGAARIALETGSPVIPVAHWGAQEILAPYARRPHLFPRKTVHVAAGPAVNLSAFENQPITPAVLKAATAAIMTDVVKVLEEIRGERAPIERFDPRKQGVSELGNPNKPKPGSAT